MANLECKKPKPCQPIEKPKEIYPPPTEPFEQCVGDYTWKWDGTRLTRKRTRTTPDGTYTSLSLVDGCVVGYDYANEATYIAKETLIITSTETITGVPINYRPQVRKTYSAIEIGEQLGISANKVGKLTNAHNLKTDEYGMYVLDKARKHNKQVENFRYYDNVVPILKAILANS